MELLDLVEGSLLGDASVLAKGRFGETHSKEQEQYLLWKRGILKENGLNPLVYNIERKLKYKDGERTYQSVLLEANNKSLFVPIHLKWYFSGKKQIPGDFVLTPEKAAIWYMDDGSYEPFKGTADLYTLGFNLESQHILQEQMKMFNINASIVSRRDKGGKHYYIHLSKNEAWKFLTMIENHVHKLFSYKIPSGYKLYANDRSFKKTPTTVGHKRYPSIDTRQEIICNNLREFYELSGKPDGFPVVQYMFWEKTIAPNAIRNNFGEFKIALSKSNIPCKYI